MCIQLFYLQYILIILDIQFEFKKKKLEVQIMNI